MKYQKGVPQKAKFIFVTWPLNLAVSVYKEAKYQNSDFYLKNWPSAAWCSEKSAKNEPKIYKFQNMVIPFDWGS